MNLNSNNPWGKTLTSVEVAQRVEKLVVARLIDVYEGTDGYGGLTMFNLYSSAKSELGDQITSGFFNKILSDLRKAGIIRTQ